MIIGNLCSLLTQHRCYFNVCIFWFTIPMGVYHFALSYKECEVWAIKEDLMIKIRSKYNLLRTKQIMRGNCFSSVSIISHSCLWCMTMHLR